MAGRGFLSEAKPLNTKRNRLKILRNGKWQIMHRPVNPDNLHFNHASLQEFGLRYYAAFQTVEEKDRVFDEKSKMDDAVRSPMEYL